jgi:hypothetical protein
MGIVYHFTKEEMAVERVRREAEVQFIKENLGNCPRCRVKRERSEPMELREWFEIWVECTKCHHRWRLEWIEQEVRERREEAHREMKRNRAHNLK